MVFRLTDDPTLFPDPQAADPDGLLAVGGDLSPERLIAAYRAGIFPWFSEPPWLWWSPDPRAVIVPDTLHIPRRLRRVMAGSRFALTTDTAFTEVCHQCAATARPGHPGQGGTWITRDMRTAYAQLHACGVAHSVEVWLGGELVGGLYGVLLGRIFCGESMFYHVPEASKVGFAWFASRFFAAGGALIDCQQLSAHMVRFGAVAMSRQEFVIRLGAAEYPLREEVFSASAPL